MTERVPAEGAINALRDPIEGFRTALNGQGLAGDDVTEDALYVLDRAQAALDNSADAPAAEDLRIMGLYFRDFLLPDLRKQAADIDRAVNQ